MLGTAAARRAARALVHKYLVDGVLLTKPLTTSNLDKAMQMARRRTPHLGRRTLDIVHVVSALELKAEMFDTFDHNQAQLAKAEGLLVTPEI